MGINYGDFLILRLTIMGIDYGDFLILRLFVTLSMLAKIKASIIFLIVKCTIPIHVHSLNRIS